MEIKELKSIISIKLSSIPPFIDTTSSLHHLVWHNGILNINSELLKLITSRILSEKIVFRIYTYISDMFDNISELISNEMHLRIIAYYSKMFIYLENICIREENYEAAANIKRFCDIYYNINTI